MTVHTSWTPRNPDYEQVVRDGFAAEAPLKAIGATLEKVSPGYVEIHAPIRPSIMTSYAPVVHGGIVGMLADAALAHAALTLAAPGAMGVTVEYKVNLIAPAAGVSVIARGSVIKPSSKMTVAQAEIYATGPDGTDRLVAVAVGTLVAL
jgi:uncharacterized protein (TIGR00369 family)